MDNIPMRPPKLPGYDFVQMLGSGATATVYLYNQRMPARPVAVKASAKTLDPRAAALFNREANFMAKLSSHPYILPVYGAGVTSDGHGYTVIEYAPGGTYNSMTATALGFAALVLATVNVVGGYLVTDRMLAMFKKKGDK